MNNFFNFQPCFFTRLFDGNIIAYFNFFYKQICILLKLFIVLKGIFFIKLKLMHIFSCCAHNIFIKQGGKRMPKCTKCDNKIQDGQLFGCTNCGKEFCEDCAQKTLKICPNCYSDLELLG